MRPSLQLKLSTHLTLTPQLQQSIRLLQLSTLELSQELDMIVSDNPLLERLDDPLDTAMRIGADGALQSGLLGPAPDPSATSPNAENGSGESSNLDVGEFNNEYGEINGSESGEGLNTGESNDFQEGSEPSDWGADSVSSSIKDNGDDEQSRDQVGQVSTTLREHLMEQLCATHCSVVDRGLVTILIDNLNDYGYLDITLEEIVAMLPEELELEIGDINAALSLLQSFDPIGVGARDYIECLLLQLSALPKYEWPGDVVTLGRLVVKNYLPLLAGRDFNRLRAALNCDDETLREVQSLIRSLNPRPGAGFGETGPNYVIPDVVVKKYRNEWRVMLNGEVVPRIRVNESYASLLGSPRGNGKALSAQLQEARWLVKNIEQRFDTILRVSQAIVDRQKAFFTHGELAMRPLVLREIAEQLGLHESTISRVTNQKYMLTPFGTLELKYFFGSHVGTEAGGAASSTAIRALIKQLINAEKSSKPLSDSRLAEMLGEQGFVVARRTVAKYREALEIPAVAQRKAL
jgi:RNA polymerase sigma-54 factor